MRPKGKLLALFAIFVAIGVVTASGAFTSTSVDRTMTISVDADSSALLGLAPNGSSVNGGYATTSSGRIQVALGTNGANLDADTHVDHVINLTNNGNADITVWATMAGTNTSAVTLYNGTVTGGSAIASSNPGETVTVGQTISVSIQIDTRGTADAAGTTLVDTVTFHAEAL
jgi:hypothetical protein